MTDIIREELFGEMPDKRQLVRIIVRLLAAMLLGAVVGIQRERTH